MCIRDRYDDGGNDGWYDDGGNDGWYDGDGSGGYDYYNDPYDYFRDYYDVQEPGGNQFMLSLIHILSKVT